MQTLAKDRAPIVVADPSQRGGVHSESSQRDRDIANQSARGRLDGLSSQRRAAADWRRQRDRTQKEVEAACAHDNAVEISVRTVQNHDLREDV